ncbi:MAG TPA: recombination protein RecR [Candidatus Kaiserbacteria bacterium]|nr:recombination protein RecR [Candidatus Kaiserbacteria bacterium]
MSDSMEQLVREFERFPGIGPRQAKRFVYYLLATSAQARATLSTLVERVGEEVKQCALCQRFQSGGREMCSICADKSRDKTSLLLVEKDQDIIAIEKTHLYKGHYFVLGGVLTLSGKGVIREDFLVRLIKQKVKEGLSEIIMALSATSEGEHTSDYVRTLLAPYRTHVRISVLGRGLATGTELEYTDEQTLSGAILNRKEF